MPSIDAHVTKVEQDPNGWYRIHTDDPNVKRLDTKQQKLGQEAFAFMQRNALVRIEYSERESGNINPHTNQPYPPNRYWEKGTELGEKPAEIPMVQPQRAVTAPKEAWRICLSAGGKLAVQTLPMMPTSQRDFETQKRIATAWAEFFYFSEPPERSSLSNGSSAFQTPVATVAGSASTHDAPPPHDDSDVPF